MKVRVDEHTCIGCNLCVSLCPQVFSLRPNGKAVAIDSDVPSAVVSAATDALQECPVEAIHTVGE